MIRWISENIGTASYNDVKKKSGQVIIDVRDLVDKPGNRPSAIWSKIQEAIASLELEQKTIICCDYGVSRSNSIAAGVLAVKKQISFDEAVRTILQTTNENSIRIETLNSVRRTLDLYHFKKDIKQNQTLKKNRLLLLGSSGYLGESVASVLRNKFQIETSNRQNFNLYDGPIPLDCFIKEKKITQILHMANPRAFGKNAALGKAVVMLKNILDVCNENKLKLIFISSFEVFSGYQKDQWSLVGEDHPIKPKGVVGESKFISEKLILLHNDSNNLKSIIVRSPLVYGGKESRPKFLHNFIERSLMNKKIIIHKYRNGYPVIDLLHIDDFCNAVLKLSSSNICGIFHIGSGEGYTSKQIAETVNTVTRSKSTIEQINIDDFSSNIVMGISKISNALEWNPKVSLQSGIRKLITKTRNE